jgi:putative aminopeptidase FrvX
VIRWIAGLVLVASTLAADNLTFHTVPAEVIQQRLERAVSKNPERQALVASLFQEAGCASLSEQPIRKKGPSNVICTLPGKSSRIILVGAHFDKVPRGDGVVDNWTGAAMLSSLHQSLAPLDRRHTFLFVSFAEEELGLVGSRHYVKELKANQDIQLAAMVNLDSLGLTPTKVWVSRSDPRLVEMAFRIAQSMKLPLEGVNVEQVGRSDSEPFRFAKVPVIDFHSLTQKTLGVLHSSSDKLQAVDRQSYYESYRLITAFLAYLDKALPVPGTKPN